MQFIGVPLGQVYWICTFGHVHGGAQFNSVPPATRLTDALHEFIRASRVQLRVEDAEHIAADAPSEWPESDTDRPLLVRPLTPWR